MPFASVDELRKSKLYQGTPVLQKMASGKLQRFIDIFNRVLARATRGGATPKDAEARAYTMALVGAQKTTIMPAGRALEEKVATYALFAQDMAHGAGVDADMKYADIGDINDIIAGQTFFGHTHDREIAEPLGVIRRMVATKDLPEDVRASVDPAILMVAQTSYFADVPDEDRLDTISPEWSTAKFASGEEVEIPTNFVTTTTPANHRSLGIGRVAEQAPDENARAYLRRIDLVDTREQMAEPTVESLKAELAKKEAELQAAPKATTLKDLQDKHAALEAKHNELVQKTAALAGVDPKGAEKPKEDEVLKTLSSKMAATEAKILAMETAAKQAEADAWADDVVKTKEISMDSKPKLASLYVANKEAAEGLKTSLSERVMKPGNSKGVVNLDKLDPKKAEEQLKFLQGAF